MQPRCTFHIGSNGSGKMAPTQEPDTLKLLNVFGASAVKFNSIYPLKNSYGNMSARDRNRAWETDIQKNVLRLILASSEKWGATAHSFFDDGLLGSLRSSVKKDGIFPRAYNNMGRIPKELDHPSTYISIAIEKYSTFFSRASTQANASQKKPVAIKKNDLLALNRTWIDVIADVARYMPTSHIAIWQMDEQLCLPQSLEKILFNVKLNKIDDQKKSSLWPHQADFWTLEEIAYLDDCYAKDLERIKENWPHFLLDQNQYFS